MLFLESVLSFFILMLMRRNFTLGFKLLPSRAPLGAKGKRFPALYTSLAEASSDSSTLTKNFISNIVEEDIRNGKNGGRVCTRFPPEPNGYLHLGHAKSICLNFGIASSYNGVTNMRFDDTNPAKEDMEYVRAILDDVRWLVTDTTTPANDPWDKSVRHASDYFQEIYDSAVYLIKEGKAYVDNLSQEQMKDYRGTLTSPGINSPYRNRSIEENLLLFEQMRDGKFMDGHCVLRAKIDMSSPNINMRDPTIYRIKRAPHPLTGDKWVIYPMYDYAHAISDALEEITHSLCTLEFADHRPLYDWTIDNLLPSGIFPNGHKGWRPVQTEFSRLNLQYTVLSKRKLIQLVSEKHVNGWDDPRMPTLCGIRRRGYPASALRLFCDRVGISKAENNIDLSVLEDSAREILEDQAPRVLAVVNPLKVTIKNWPANVVEDFSADTHQKREDLGKRSIPFSSTLCIDRDDFFDTV
jgi:glutaminyl-tRNA synthetase